MRSKSVPDAAAREQALDARQSFLVQAPAGSGKTELLIQRYLTLLARVDEPEAVVAITFTRKAAGEMRDRVLRALDRAANGLKPDGPHEQATYELACKVSERDSERHWNLRQMPARLRIQTIDSLCAAIAHSMPAVCGFGGTPEVADSPDDLYAAAAHQTILRLGSDSPQESGAVATLLAHVDNDVSGAEKLIVGMLQKRDQWLRLVGNGAGDLPAVRRKLDDNLEQIICRCLRRVRAAVPNTSAKEMIELARFAANQPVNAERDMRHCMQLASLPGCNLPDLPAWLGIADLLLKSDDEWRLPRGIDRRMGFAGGADEVPERARLQRLVEELAPCVELLVLLQQVRGLPPATVTDAQWEILQALFRLLPAAVAELKLLFAAQSTVDFAEIAHAASQALGTRGTPTDLALALGYRIEHLLVDEYQDTSVTQQELLEKLTATWEPGDGRTVFLVGDPMQSIYRFRQAEVGLFIDAAVRSSFGEVRLTNLQLTANFRSQRGIVKWVNDGFSQVFPPLSDIGTGAVAYTAAVAVHPPAALPSVKIHAAIGRDDEAEADRLLELIRAARERDSQASVAVLVRGRPHLAALVPKLRERALTDERFRFRAVEIDTLSRRQVVVDLVSVTRALLHLADRISWLSVLRSPWCGLTAADLYALCAGDTTSCLWDLMREREGRLSPDGRQRITRLREIFDAALRARGRQSLAQAVRGVWLALGGPAACAGQTDMDDASSFFELLEALETGGELPGSLQFNERLEKLFAAPDTNADGKLQLMTIHKAKGLEFDTVIVPGLGRIPPKPDNPLLVFMERATPEGDSELLLAPIKRKGGDDDELYRYIQRLDRQRGVEESKRLLYVAATRARTQLHLLGHAVLNGRNEPRAEANSLLSFLWPVVASEYQQAASRTAQGSLHLAASAETKPVPPRQPKRLPSRWTTPACPERLQCELPATAPRAEISFDWAGDTARHVGTVTHAFLHKIAREGLTRWDNASLDSHRERIRAALRECGVHGAELGPAVTRVETALRKTLADERGRWLLKAHIEAASELEVTGLCEGQPRRFILDRTFVDEQGIRWVVDYKTGEREGAGQEEFLKNEVERYRRQLQDYERVMTKLDARPVKLALYFPLLGAWREVSG